MIYHILNGDSSFEIWKKNNFEGSSIVFREMLVEGNCFGPLFTASFFESRTNFLNSNFNISSNEYASILLAELQQLNHLNPEDEIVLWFEHDLFCQVNLMAILAFITQKNFVYHKISIINTEKNKGLGEYKIQDYPRLFEERLPLSENDLEYASQFWEKYTADDLKDFLLLIHHHPDSFAYLKETMIAHLERFPNPRTGLNKLERRILKFLNDEPLTLFKLIGKLLRRQTWEGFGDLQYEHIIKRLSMDLIELKDGKYYLTLKGGQVLRGTQKYDDSTLSYMFLGGAVRTDYYFDGVNNLVIERK
ncbi:DUF1835 domain-containing protein [Flammeovirga sp. SJP92]|uniref:DUF1835 domain-containing protein n=1 Tax=Flammeovirga sp. SJP92 TaxID=1775430 RepID=UPI000787CED1|nr:hypothetical protein [Flammeovirga sp. SJP92]KXX69914.1 hypothetical protein AVL50_13620 [Flammeovirga sp. SJP92]